MAIGVGLRIGRIVSTAVVASNEPGTPDPVVIARDTVLHIDHDGNSQLGGSTRTIDEARTVRVPVPCRRPRGNCSKRRPRLPRRGRHATAVHCLLNECHPLPTFGGMDRDTDPGYTATYPSHWDPTRVSVLRAALDYAELRHVDLVSDAQGAATWYASEISETPGLLIGVYHVDDAGSTVTLVRSGVPAGKAFRVAAKGAPSPAAQLARALGAFGWMPDNLDAVVVMGDGLIARDRSHIQDIANSLATKLMVRSLVGPGPEQTAALGAAILATGFTPAREKKARIGLPPSYDRTDVLTGGFARVREAESDSEEDPPVAIASTTDSIAAGKSAGGPSRSEVVGEDQAALTGANISEPPPEPKVSTRAYALAGIGAVIVVILILALML